MIAPARFKCAHWMLLAVFALVPLVVLAQQEVSRDQNAQSQDQRNMAPQDAKDQGASEKKVTDAVPADQQQMRDLDEQVQDIKTDALSIAAELSQLEEKLLYPSGTQVAVFVALAKGDQMRLDAVQLQVDGQLVAHYIYSFKELDALRRGGVQRIYVGNVATGDHQLDVLVDGKLESGADFNRTDHFTFRKEVKPKMVELTVAGAASGGAPITIKEW